MTADRSAPAVDDADLVNGPEDVLGDWDEVEWRRVEQDVRRLRQRIFTASQAGDLKRVRNRNHSGPGRCEAGDGRTIAAGPVSSWAGEPVPGFSGLVGQRRYGLDAAAGSQGRPANRSRSTARACWPFLRAVDR